ncbi:MAG: hypothetical protein JWL81_1343 [Verrucomicrobiales bacterium]|nr:hypothetical protein [Verrucomicrobiales bacterium]
MAAGQRHRPVSPGHIPQNSSSRPHPHPPPPPDLSGPPPTPHNQSSRCAPDCHSAPGSNAIDRGSPHPVPFRIQKNQRPAGAIRAFRPSPGVLINKIPDCCARSEAQFDLLTGIAQSIARLPLARHQGPARRNPIPRRESRQVPRHPNAANFHPDCCPGRG